MIPTQGVPPQHPAPDEGQADTEGRRRDWRHIARTRARTSTVLLVGVFLLCCVLYGYTSQRYGIVDPPARPAPKSTTQTVEPSYEAPSSTFSSTTEESSSTTDTSSGVDGTEGTSGTDSQVPTTTTTRPTVPGLPNIPIPGFGGQTPTTTVPTR
ncbi:hypothetical protein [Gordonia sp. 'Campus']|uniref:hypothetical protein n=1 Tax=Gordonia sp. 'Campus' TaxID=2915824 RepID=UPI001EE4968F|nr:hypothetical protein [Gordonia sp. 'Campus']